MTADDLRCFHRYHRWARGRLLASVEALAPEAFAPLRAGLVRWLWTDWVWLRRCFGLSPRIVFDPDDYPDVAALRDRWAEVDAEMDDLLGPLTDMGLSRPVAYRDLCGRAAEAPLERVLLHVVERGSRFRGDVAAQCRRPGAAELAPTDWLTFWEAVGKPTDEVE